MLHAKLYDTYDFDRRVLLYFFQNCSDVIKELYNIEIDTVKFIDMYMKSDMRKQADERFEGLVFKNTKQLVKLFLEVDLDGNLDLFPVGERTLSYNELFWAGMMYAYIKHKTGLYMSEICSIVDINYMEHIYGIGCEMSLQNNWSKMKGLFEDVIRSSIKQQEEV